MGDRMEHFRTNIGSAGELVRFIWQGKVWWLTPIVLILLILTALVVFLESSALAPFIYTLF